MLELLIGLCIAIVCAPFYILLAIGKAVKTSSQRKRLQREYDRALRERQRVNRLLAIDDIDDMDGHDFEYWCADLLADNGFTDVQVTPGSGDMGVDIIAYSGGEKWAFQCKRFSKPCGNKPIQEVDTGARYYGCERAAVMTNQYFTKSATKLAESVDVELLDRDTIADMISTRGQQQEK